MRARLLALTLVVVAGGLALRDSAVPEPPRPEKAPSEWFHLQRAWPYPDIRQESRLAAYEQSRALRREAQLERSGAAAWSPAGATNIGGRIADLVCHPSNPNVVYLGTASGGVFKTTNGGNTWTPLFDEESSLSIGSLDIDPTNPDVLYVGTGEPNGGGGSVTYGGTGIFKTTNGGASWTNVGLTNTRYIGRVAVDPSNPSTVFVAALGSYYSTGSDRGLYRSTDSGGSWTRVLASTDSTGAVDVVVHPTDSDLVYCALWERTRGPDFYHYGGESSGLFRSTDGGDTWSEMTSGLPSGPDVGRIGIAQSQSSPSTLYAVYAEASPGEFVGVYKTTNGGTSWSQTNDGALAGASIFSSFGWWFGNIRVDPANANRVFVLGLPFWMSTNGGNSWFDAGGSMHVDHHALDFASNGDIWEGNDGGVYRSTNGGTFWTKLPNLPATQFYTVEVDAQFPNRRYGGTQDNGTNRTLTGGLADWEHILGGDGFYVQVDKNNNQYVYAEWQYGNINRSTDGGNSFSWAASALSGRKNWSMPIILDPNAQATVFVGTDRVYRSTNRAVSWTSISGDLTDGPGGGNVTFGTITTLDVAPTSSSHLLAGTDDGNVQVSTNGGGSWTQVDSGIPDRWVTRVAFDPTDETILYVTVSGFRWDEPLPHVFRSTNTGASWTDISSNLPEAPVNDIVVDPENTSRLFVATDFGAYESVNLGASWAVLGTDLPNVVVTDLELHANRTLTAATFGRSMWTLDVSQTSSEVTGPAAALAGVPQLSPARPNPARAGGTSLAFSLPVAAEISIRVYDLAGRRIADLADGPHAAGTHEVSWDGRSASGARVAAGVYLVRLEADGLVRTRKVTVLR